jgi:hypothetical protein
MNAPVGPLLRTLAERILANVDLIGQQDADFGDMDQNRAPYPDTQLLISLLGVLVFPHERTPGALGRLLKNYEALSNVVTIRYPKLNQSDIELVEASGERHRIDPTSIEELPRLLRNSIAHFNILPISKDGRFAGVRVWNKDEEGRTTLVADLDFDTLRPLARYILDEIAHTQSDLELEDPSDPLEELENQVDPVDIPTRRRKPPRIIDSTWAQILKANQNNYDAAKRMVDRCLQDLARNHNSKTASLR